MEKYILVIDQGTTSSRAILFNRGGLTVAFAQKELDLEYPQNGYVEVDANELFSGVVEVIEEALSKARLTWKNIACVGITNQRETTVVWSRISGLPIAKAIVWQSRQSQEICDRLVKHQEKIQEKTGLLINPYFSASKIRFILDRFPRGQQLAEKGELMFGTVDSWLIYKLTKGEVHATDITNASRTLLFNINTCKWDKELLRLFNIPEKMLPKVYPCDHNFGNIKLFNTDTPITGVIGDQQAALFGQNCFHPGMSKATYGTGCFMLMNIGKKPVLSKKGLLTTIAWSLNGEISYALEGSVFVCGSAIKWLRDNLHVIQTANDINLLAQKVSDTGGVYFVPAFVGLGTPYWDDNVRGAFFGISSSTAMEHFALATLQAIAFQCRDVFSVMEKEAKMKINCLYIDGGVTNSEIMNQFQSDILNIKVSKPTCLESTAIGAAFMAGLGSGFFHNLDEISKAHTIANVYYPRLNDEEREKLYNGWKMAVKSAMKFKN